MGKRKLFEKIDQTLPVTGAERSSKGVIQFPLATIPPTATSVPIGRIAGGQRNFDFKDFYGHGVDEVAFALQRQIERFVAGEEKNLANASVLTICRCGVTPFLDYMIARSTAEQRDFTLGDINRNLIDGFLGWLRHGDTKLGSQRSCYSSFKSVLFSLGKRGLITVVDEGDDRTFPKNPFPGAFRSHKGAKPLPKGQRQAFAKALRKTVLPLFHSDALLNTYAPKRDGETCSNYLNCLRCRNYVVTGDDLYKLFSFGMRILKERNRIAKQKWKKHFAHIPRLIERDVIQQGIEQKKFKPEDVDAARERAKHDPHPFWLTDSLVADLEALG